MTYLLDVTTAQPSKRQILLCKSFIKSANIHLFYDFFVYYCIFKSEIEFIITPYEKE